jgi:septal ring factor EnvC (AmiA/AmiB activator)
MREEAEERRRQKKAELEEEVKKTKSDAVAFNEAIINRQNNIESSSRETIDEGKRTIEKVTVVKGVDTIIYQKITYRYGAVYYFMDEKSITEIQFNRFTAGR